MPTIELRPNKPQFATVPWIKPGHATVLPWGRGVGKTYWIQQNWFLLVAQWDGVLRNEGIKPFRGVKIIVLMPTLKQFKDVHGADLVDNITGMWAHLGGKLNRSTWEVNFPGGSSIKPFPAREHSAQVARGMRCDMISGDEIDDIDPSTYESVAVPWLSAPWSLAIELGGGTPKRGRHGLLYRFHKLGLDPAETKFHTLHATYKDAPETVSLSAVERAHKTTPPQVFRREWLCDFDAAEGLVYGDVWNAAFHVRDFPEDTIWTDVIIGLDHGFEHPGAAILLGVLGKGRDATVWAIDEIYAQHKVTSWWATELEKWADAFPGLRIKLYADPSRKDSIAEYNSRLPMRVRKANNAVNDGISSVADRLLMRTRGGGEDDQPERRFAHLYVAPRCQNLIREMGVYRWKPDPKEADHYLDEIDKRNDDAQDALRYAIFSHLGPGLSSIRGYAHHEDRE